MTKEKRTVEGPGFVMTGDSPPDKSDSKDTLLALSIVVVWVLWVVAYVIFVRPFVSDFLFNVLRLPWFPVFIHFLLMFLIPGAVAISITHILRLFGKNREQGRESA